MFAWSRKKAIALNTVLIIVLSMPAVLGYNVWSFIQPMGEGSTIMDLEDFLVSQNLLPLGTLIYLLFCVKKNGWGWDSFYKEVNSGTGMKFPKILRGYMTYVLPAIIIGIYLKGYWDKFAPMGMSYLIPWLLIAFSFLGFVFWIVKS